MPYVTIGIIAACTLMQVYASFVAPSTGEIMRDPVLLETIPIVRWGYQTGSGLDINLIASAFVHDGWFHLIGNMLFLWLAGSAVEDRWGHVRYAIFYLAGAAASTYVFEALHTGTAVLVGASGAVTATMGAFLVHFSKTEITFWYFWLYRTGTFQLPAWLALPMWLADQVLWAYLTEAHGVATGVAYTAHLGGFGFGFAAAFAMRRFLPADDDAADDERVDAPPAAPAPDPGDRYHQLVAAIDARDLGSVRTLSSRTILDLARDEDHPRIVELYKAMAAKLERLPLTDGAFVAAAMAADTLGDDRTFIEIAEAVIAEHPGSNQVPKVMWRLAEHRRDLGDVDAAIELLRTLAVRFPRDPHAQRARQALDSRGIG